MKVIFVASGNKRVGAVSSFVRSQYESLKAAGLDMLLFPVSGHGAWAYLKGVWRLRKIVRREKPDIIHAHYSTCGFVASLATLCMCHRPKIVVSILGSFPTRDAKWRRVRWAIQHLWDGALTKSERTRSQLGLDLPVIPNGVNLEVFHPTDYEEARRIVGFDVAETKTEINTVLAINTDKLLDKKNYNENTESSTDTCSIPNSIDHQFANEQDSLQPNAQSCSIDSVAQTLSDDSAKNTKNNSSTPGAKKYVIWCSHPTRVEKNWKLAEDAVRLLESKILDTCVQLVAVYDKTPEEVCTFMNAADCLLLTSWSEGSPNVIKEAMACNCPIVTTDVGDVNERLKNLEGCYVAKTDHPVTNEETHTLYAEENANALADCLLRALTFGKRTKGYDRIHADGLTLELTAQKIIKWYQSN